MKLSALFGDWMRQARCARPEVDPDWFFPELTSSEREIRRMPLGEYSAALAGVERRAKRMCAMCPVRRPCLELGMGWEGRSYITLQYDDHAGKLVERTIHYAIEGIWGGSLPSERKRWRSLDYSTDRMLAELSDQALAWGLATEEEVG